MLKAVHPRETPDPIRPVPIMSPCCPQAIRCRRGTLRAGADLTDEVAIEQGDAISA